MATQDHGDIENKAADAPSPNKFPRPSLNNATTQALVTDDDFNPPDGGLQAWSQVLASHLINVMTWGYAASYGVYQLHYENSLRLPSSQVSWIGSAQIFLTFGMCVVSGRLTDAGYARETAAAGCFLAVLGTFMTSLATQYWQIFLAQGVATGVGLGMAFMPAVSVSSSYFDKNRAFALAVAAMGTSVGSLIFPSTVQYLIPQVGFPWAVRCAAFVALVVCMVACLLLKPRLSPRKAGSFVEWEAFRELPYVLFALGSFLNFYGLYFGFFYVGASFQIMIRLINSYARNVIGFSSVDSVNLLLITNAVGVPTRPVVGYLASNFFGPINVFIVATMSVSAVVFGWTGVTTRTDMYIFSAFFGLAISANQGTFVSSLASLTKDPRKMGVRFGMVETLCSFATLAGAPTAGAIIDRSGGRYLWAQIWGGGIMAAAALVFAASRIATTGWRWRVQV